MKQVSTPLWRVIFTTGALRSGVATERGPWHEKRGIAKGCLTFFAGLGRDERLQVSKREIYENGRLVAAGAKL